MHILEWFLVKRAGLTADNLCGYVLLDIDFQELSSMNLLCYKPLNAELKTTPGSGATSILTDPEIRSCYQMSSYWAKKKPKQLT